MIRYRLAAALGSVCILVGALTASPSRAVVGGDDLDIDPRVNQANGLLGDAQGQALAAELYREVLVDQPEHASARLWLARVLSWRGDYDQALAHYQTLRAQGAKLEEVRVERAEVLSWAGRYAEAETGFESVLEDHPEHARAARGLARVYAWSGRPALARPAYQRALALEEDAEARHEYSELLAGIGGRADGSSRYLSDSDGFQTAEVTVAGTWDFGFESRLLYRVGFTRAHKDRDPSESNATEDADAVDAMMGYEQEFGEGLKVSVQAGYRRWSHARDHVLARGALEYHPVPQSQLSFQIEHGDLLSRSGSLDAVLEGLYQTSLQGSVWHGFSDAFSAFGRLETSFISDSNRRISLGGSGSYRPWISRDVRVGLQLDYLTYTQRASEYYDPEYDVGAAAFVAASLPVLDWLTLSAEVNTGWGWAVEASRPSSGFTYGVAGEARFEYEGWWASLKGARSQSIRATDYITNGGSLAIGKSF